MKFAVIFLSLASAAAQAQFNCTTNRGAITISGYTGPGRAVTIPDIINGLPVTNIGTNAFYNCTRLTSVTIPSGVTNIGDWAFFDCARLTSVSLPNSITRIGEAAFYNCTSLTNITIPTNIISIGHMAFWFCTNLIRATNIPVRLVTKPPTTHWRNLASSYADLYVEPLLPPIGYACEVGANDGLRESNTLLFENKGWTVLCIEPNPLLTVSLSQNRKLWRAVACGAQRADDVKFVICGSFPYDSASGFHTGTGPYPCLNPKIVNVKVQPLRDVLDEVKFPRLDLLTIDVEGHELEVLKGMDFTLWHPKFVIVEDTTNAEAIRAYLQGFGYESWARRSTDNIYGLSTLRRKTWKIYVSLSVPVAAGGITIYCWLRHRRRKMTAR